MGAEVVIIAIVIFVVILIIVVTYTSQRHKAFAEQAEKFLRKEFPDMEILVRSVGGGLSMTDIQASSRYDKLRYLNVHTKTERRGKYSHTYLIVKAELQMNSFPYSFFSTIRKEGYFNKFFRGENFEIGDSYVDDFLLINVQPVSSADLFFSLNSQFLPSLAKNSDLNECKINSEPNNYIYLSIKSNTYNLHSLKRSISALKTLIPLPELEEEYPEPIEISTPEKRIYAETKVAEAPSSISIDEVFKKLRTRVKTLDLTKHIAEITLNSGLFTSIIWKWDKEKLFVTASGNVRNAVKLKVEMKSASEGSNKEFSWFKPYDKIELMVEPLLLQDEVLNAYDIAMNFNGIKREKILTKLKFIAENNDALLELETEAHPDNVRQIFELLSLFSWEWLTNFVLV